MKRRSRRNQEVVLLSHTRSAATRKLGRVRLVCLRGTPNKFKTVSFLPEQRLRNRRTPPRRAPSSSPSPERRQSERRVPATPPEPSLALPPVSPLRISHHSPAPGDKFAGKNSPSGQRGVRLDPNEHMCIVVVDNKHGKNAGQAAEEAPRTRRTQSQPQAQTPPPSPPPAPRTRSRQSSPPSPVPASFPPSPRAKRRLPEWAHHTRVRESALAGSRVVQGAVGGKEPLVVADLLSLRPNARVTVPAFSRRNAMADWPPGEEFSLPEHYLRWREPGLSELERSVEYEIDSDDEEFLKAQARNPNALDHADFEQLMDMCEKECVRQDIIHPRVDGRGPFSEKDDGLGAPRPPRTGRAHQPAIKPTTPHDQGGGCGVCGSHRGLLVTCVQCGARVHTLCHLTPSSGERSHKRARPEHPPSTRPSSALTCARCKVDKAISCHLCGSGDGILLPTPSPEVWVHMACGRVWVCPTIIGGVFTNFVPPALPLLSGQCCVCGRSAGVTLRCVHAGCSRFLHGQCALNSGTAVISPVERVASSTSPASARSLSPPPPNPTLLCPAHTDLRGVMSTPPVTPLPIAGQRRCPLLPGQHLQWAVSDVCDQVAFQFRQVRVRDVPTRFWLYWALKRLRNTHTSLVPVFQAAHARYKQLVCATEQLRPVRGDVSGGEDEDGDDEDAVNDDREEEEEQESEESSESDGPQSQWSFPLGRANSNSNRSASEHDNGDNDDDDWQRAHQYRQIKGVRNDMEKARLLFELLKKRERAKLELVQTRAELARAALEHEHAVAESAQARAGVKRRGSKVVDKPAKRRRR